ncbi:Protein EMSY-LIKE 3, variant 2 [Ancistrocladus abbreviatus]
MEYEISDSSGTDDDLPPSHQNRFARGGRVAGNGRSAVAGSTSFPRMHNDMETQIHLIEQEAYCSVLLAFKAQSDAITWEKESLITELRKELRVSDEEHRELLSRVHADNMIKTIREWRKTNGLQPSLITASQPVHDNVPSPTVSASRKKPKTSQSAASLSVGGPSPVLHPSMQPSSSSLKRGPPPGSRGKKTKPSMEYPSNPGRAQVAKRSNSGAFAANEQADAANYDRLIGRKVWTRWPEDNNFYEAVITDYKEGLHALVYDMHTTKEAWEWVNLKEISPEDIRWEGDDPGISHKGVRSGSGRGFKKSMTRGGAVAVAGAGRGRGSSKGQPKKDLFLSQNGIGKKASGDIELLHTDTLIKEEHEQALVDAIARLEDASDGESDKGDHPFSQGQSMDQERGWRKRQYHEMGDGRRIEGLDVDGDKIAREGRAASDKRQDGDHT